MAISVGVLYESVGTVYLANGNDASGKYECRLLYKCTEQNIANNYSKLYAELQVRSVNNGYKTYGRTQTTKINDETVNTATEDMRNINVWQIFGGKTFTIYHNADGRQSFTIRANFSLSGVSGYSLGNGNASATFDLPTIPRTSSVTIDYHDFFIGDTITIYTNRASNNFTHHLYYNLNGKNYEIASNVGDNYKWTIPNSFISVLNNTTSSGGRIYCDTIANGNVLGNSSVYLAIYVPENITPFINSINIEEANPLPKKLGIYVQGKSQLNISINASGNQGSTIKSYKITGIDNTIYSQSSFKTNILSNTGNNTITVTIVDSRGRTATKTATYNLVPYSNPSITEVSSLRSNSDGSNNEEGTFLKYNFIGSVSTLNNKNTHAYKLGYRIHNNGSYTWVNINNNSYSINQKNIVLPNVKFDITKSYDILFKIEDYFGTTERLSSLGTVADLINFNASGKAIAFGKISEAGPNEKLFEVGMDTIFNNRADFKDNIYINGIEFLNKVYPVGSVYISFDSTSPAILFGGAWSQIKGRFLLGVGHADSNTDNFYGNLNKTDNDYWSGAGSMAGQFYHQLDINEIPSHNHNIYYNTEKDGIAQAGVLGVARSASNDVQHSAYGDFLVWSTDSGGNRSHNNMPPFITVYMWHRIS